jgi:hypothetical protein
MCAAPLVPVMCGRWAALQNRTFGPYFVTMNRIPHSGRVRPVAALQNSTFGPYFVTMNRILILVVCGRWATLQGALYVAKAEGKPTQGARVALVLGAGNQLPVVATDILHVLIAEDAVAVVKMNPVNEYLGPFIVYEDRAFGCQMPCSATWDRLRPIGFSNVPFCIPIRADSYPVGFSNVLGQRRPERQEALGPIGGCPRARSGDRGSVESFAGILCLVPSPNLFDFF